jgi:hypothetical protein
MEYTFLNNNRDNYFFFVLHFDNDASAMAWAAQRKKFRVAEITENGREVYKRK